MYPVVVFLISALVATPAAADLYDALQEAGSSAYTYTMTGDETATKDYGSPYNKRFTLNGEGYTLYGMGYNGFEFQSSTLAVNNVTFDGFSKAFRVPYSGGSNMTLNDVTFQNNDYGFYALGAEGLYITLNNVKFANNGMDMRNVGQSVTFTGESELTTLNYGVDADGSEYNRRYGGFTIDTGAKLTLLNAGHLYDENLINKGTLDNISGGEMALRTLKNETGATVINNGVLDVNRDGYNNSEITTTDGQGRFLFTSWPYENGEYYSKNSFDNKGTIAQDSVTVAGDFFNRSDATINTKVLNFGWAYGDGYVLRGSNTSNEDKDQVETTFYHSGVIEGIETLNVEDGIFQNWATISDLREMNLGRNDGTVGQFSNLSSQVLNVDTINVVGKPIGFKYYYESSWGGTSSSWYSFYGKISNSVDATLKANNIHVKTLPYKPPYTYYDRLYVNEISNSGHMEVSDEILLESGYLNQSDGYLKANTLTIAGDEENASYARLYQGTAEINTLVHRKQDEGKLSDLRIYSGSLYLGSAMTLSVTDLQNDGGVDNYSQDVYITHGYNTSSISGDGQLVFTGGANDTFTNSGNISGQSINLGASTFKMTKDGTLDMANGKTFRASGGTFDVLNGAAQDQHLGAVVLDDNLTLLIDADLAEQKADYFSADSLTNDGNHSIIIDAIQILSDTDTLPIKTKVADTVLMSAFKLADSGVRLSNAAGVTGSYAVLYDAIADDGGYLTFDNLRNLVTVSRATEEQRQYNLREDESIAADIAAIGDNSAAIGVMGGGGSTLTVNGKDAEGKTYRIVGDGNGGILVSSGNNLIFNDVKEIREFTTAVTNYYDVVVNNTTFKDNNVDIDNYSSLKFLGDNQVETITGTGQIYVGNDDTTGSLTVAENGSVENGFLYNYAGGVFENKGQTEINYVYNYSSAANGQILNHSSGTFKTRELRNQDGSKFDNRGTVNLDNYYNYTGATTDNSGTFTVSSHTFRNFANFNNAVSGIVNSLYINNEQEGSVINNSGLLNIDSQIFNQSNATINNATSGTINVGMQFYNSHEVNNDGNITTKEFYNYSTVTNNGTVRVNYGNNNGVITSTANDGGKLIVAPGNQYFTNTGTIEKNDVILNGGVLRLSRGVFDMEGQDFTSEGGQLYVQNNAVAQQHLGNVILKKDMKVLIDANLAEQIADNFTAASLSNEDNHNILISSIKVLNDGENKFVKTKVADTVLMNAFKLDDNVTIDNSSGVSGSYAVVYSAIANDGGYLNFDNKNINLVIVSRDTADQRVYVLGDDESIAADIDVIGDASTAIGDMGGTNSTLTINGNGNVADADKYYSVIGDELGGLTVGSGQTLNINNVGRVDDDANVAGGWKNFKISDGGAVIVANNGSVVSVNNTVFTENKAGSVRAEAGAQVALDNVAVVNNASNSGVSNKGELSLTNGLIKGNTFVGTNNSGSYPAVGVYNAGHITNLEADFVDNSMTLTANAQALGGGVMNMSQIDNIKGRFEGNSLETRSNAGTNRWSATGGAIYNYNSAVIGRIEADFVNNEVTNTAGNASVGGGAIYNATGAKIGDIVGNIEGNKILANNNAYGGAIYNSTSATIGDIVGDITNNESHSTNGPARGGVIFNVRAQIGDLKGENGAKASYSGNRAISDTNAADGGVIHNQGQANGVKGIVNSIYADFADNSVQGAGQASGGAVNNNTNTLIREGINGDFTKNYALSTDNLARGGAIIDLGYIENVTGTMDTNYAESHGIGAVGGAIALFKNSSSSDLAAIGLVEGHFVDNYAMATGDDGYAQGGFIYNTTTVGLVSGDIVKNYAVSDNGAGEGGAIYNDGFLAIKDASFVDNAATTAGGAIYNKGELSLIGNINFSGNKIGVTYTRDEETKKVSVAGGEANAIHNVGTLHINGVEDDDEVSFADAITGDEGVIVIGEEYAPYAKSDGYEDNDDTYTKVRFVEAGYATSANAKYTFSRVEQKEMNIFSGTVDIDADDLKISDGVKNAGEILLGEGTLTSDITENAGVKGTVRVDGDVVNNATINQDKIQVTDDANLKSNANTLISENGIENAGVLNFTGGTNSNDIVKFEDKLGDIIISGDTINNANSVNADKFSVADEKVFTNNADKTVTTETLDNQGKIANNGTFNINKDGENAGIISGDGLLNLAGKLDNLADGAKITQKTITLAEEARLDSYAGTLSASDKIANDGELYLKGGDSASNALGQQQNVINGTGAVHVTAGVVNNSAVITQKAIDVAEDAKLITNAEKLVVQDDIANAGVLELTGGNNVNVIKGDGALDVSGAVVNANNTAIEQREINVTENGAFTANASDLKTEDGIHNAHELTLTGGVNENDIDGEGDLKITGVVDNQSNIAQNSVDIATNAALTTEIRDIDIEDGIKIAEKGRLTLVNSAENAAQNVNHISGQGETEIKGDVVNAGNISTDLTLSSGMFTAGEGTLNLAGRVLKANGGSFNTSENSAGVDTIEVGKVDLTNTDLNWKLDVDLDGVVADYIKADEVAGTHKVLISEIDINLLTDASDNLPIYVPVVNDVLKSHTGLTEESLVIHGVEPSYSYVIGYNEGDDNGELTFGYGDLYTAVKLPGDDKQYVMNDHENVERDLGDLNGEKLTITGNGNNINGQGHQGIVVAENQRFNVNDVQNMSGFDTAITNEGTVTLNDVALSDNENADINNNGTLNVHGDVSVEKIIGEGTLNVNDSKDGTLNVAKDGSVEQNTINVAENNRILNQGEVTVDNLNNAGEIDNAGTLAVEDGTNDGDIKGDGTMTIAGDFANNGSIEQGQIDVAEDAKVNNSSDITADKLDNQGAIDNSGTVTVADLANAGEIDNAGTLAVEDGTNDGDIKGDGTMTVAGDFANKGSIEQGEIDVAEDAKVNNSNDVTADKLDNQGAIDNSGTVTVADLANAGEIDNAGILAVEDGSNDGDIKGDGTMTIARDFANNGSIEQGQIDVAEDAKVNNSSDITADKLDNQGAIDNSGTVTVADLANAGEVDNAGTLAVKDGTNDGDIKGDGTMTVAGDFANNGKITQKNIDILSDGVLTSEVTKIVAADGINNDGELNIHGARNENDIRGSGVVNINSAMALVGQIGGSNTVNVNEGLLTLEQDNVLGSGIILNVAAQDKDAALAVDDKTINVKEVHFGENSTVNFDIKSLSDFGQIVADTITIAQGAKLHATLGQGLATMNEPSFFPLLKATNTDFNNFTDSYEMAANNMYQFEKEGLDGMYKITLIKTAADVAEDVDAHRDIVDAAHAWVDGNRFADEKGQGIADELAKLAQEDAKGFKKALESLVPSAAPIVKTLSLEHAQYLHDMLVNHLYGQGEQQGIGSGDEVQTIDASAWVKTYAAHSRLDAHNYVAGFDINRRGAVFGLDKLIRKGLRAGFGYGTDTTKAKSSQRRDKVHTHSVFVYGQYKPSDWYVDSLMSYSRGKYSEDKYSMNHKYHASYDVDDIYADAKTGYNFNLYNKWVVTPEGGLEYHYIDRGSYHDNARQKVSSHDMHVLTAAGGVKVSTEFEVDENVLSRSAKVRPEVYLGASYDMVSDRDRAFVSLANGSDYTVHGNQLGRFAVETKVGVKASFEDKVDVSLHYMGNYRSNYRAHAGMLELKVRF